MQSLVSQWCQTGQTGISLEEYSCTFTLAYHRKKCPASNTERQEGEGIIIIIKFNCFPNLVLRGVHAGSDIRTNSQLPIVAMSASGLQACDITIVTSTTGNTRNRPVLYWAKLVKVPAEQHDRDPTEVLL